MIRIIFWPKMAEFQRTPVRASSGPSPVLARISILFGMGNCGGKKDFFRRLLSLCPVEKTSIVERIGFEISIFRTPKNTHVTKSAVHGYETFLPKTCMHYRKRSGQKIVTGFLNKEDLEIFLGNFWNYFRGVLVD